MEEEEEGGFDAFGFPKGQTYIPSSAVAPVSSRHHQRWVEFWAGYHPSPAAQARLRRLVWGGVPTALRGRVWAALLGTEERQRQWPEYFGSLLAKVGAHEADTQIAQDAVRTWPRHSSLDVAALERVLRAFARHNRSVGYCQGLNSVAACLLLFMDEHDAFWALVEIVEARLPEGFWGETLWRCR